ncbi:MAG: hypothetical protein HZB16_12355 [Armatimonadetes bacterium]|nr:hypothetical protein [Armatimonadota bacterium]
MSADTKKLVWLGLAGYLCGTAAMAVAWTVAARPHGLFHLPALLSVFLAGAAFTLVGARSADWQVLRSRPEAGGETEAKARLIALAAVARAEGARGLERQLPHATQPLERQGLNLLVDGCGSAELQAALQAAADAAGDADHGPARVWRLLSSSFVNAGIVVTLIGMVRTLLGNGPEGPPPEALAGALTAAVYGIVVGLGVLHPRVGRARVAARAAAAQRRVWIEGLVAIAGGIHPRRLADRWNMDSSEAPLLRRVA